MHFLDPFVPPSTSRSKLGATLTRLHRHLEVNRQRDLLALKAFDEWEARSSGQCETILQQLDCLNRELSELSAALAPVPRLSLVSESTASERGSGKAVNDEAAQSDDDCGIISSPMAPWHGA